jgi:hypothetical protein
MQIFLDVENLTSIGALEDLIARSETVLVFLSTGYFARYCRLSTYSATKRMPCAHTRLVAFVYALPYRWNCLREVHESIMRKKDIVLMREVAEMHGGGVLDLVFNEIEHHKALWAELDEAHGDKSVTIYLQKTLFNEDRGDVVLWHRVLEFKRVALKMLIARVLQQQGVEHTGLSIPGELTLHRLKIPPLTPSSQKYHLCLPQHESSSKKIESKLRNLLQSMPKRKGLGENIQRRSSVSWRESPAGSVGLGAAGSVGGCSSRSISSSVSARPVQSGDLSRAISSSVTVTEHAAKSDEEQVKIGICGEGDCRLDNSNSLLFPLRTASFANKALMHELRCALVFGVNIVTVHARDPAAVVEDFDKFIGACPADIKSGLVRWQGGEVQCPRLFDGLAVDWFDAPG